MISTNIILKVSRTAAWPLCLALYSGITSSSALALPAKNIDAATSAVMTGNSQTATNPIVVSTITDRSLIPDDSSAELRHMQNVFTELAQQVEPMVVNIKTVRAAATDDQQGDQNPPGTGPAPPNGTPIPPNGIPLPPGGAKPHKPTGPVSPFANPPARMMATGSGVIVRSDGYILTNDHVINGAIGGMVTVTLSDGREFRGKVYPDYRSDLAIVKIDPGNSPLPVANFAPDSSVHAGQWAIAIGSPFDLENTMTVGVVSAVGRHQEIPSDGVTGGRYYPDLVQTDAAINPGNSGGPLFNISGQVIGINVAIESPVDGSAGIGFAIPTKVAVSVMDDLINSGKVVRGYLGIAPIDLTPALMNEFGTRSGAFLRDVGLDSPAGKAGLQAADIITEFDGQPIAGELDLREAIATAVPDKAINVVFIRQGKEQSASVIVGKARPVPEDTLPPAIDQQNARLHIGVTVRDLTSRDRQSLNVDPSTVGVFVLGVEPHLPAADAAEEQGITLAGSIIERIGNRNITSKDDFEQALADLKDADQITLIVLYNADSSVHQAAMTIRS